MVLENLYLSLYVHILPNTKLSNTYYTAFNTYNEQLFDGLSSEKNKEASNSRLLASIIRDGF